MLGKLIKYDIKSMSKTFIPLWVLTPVIAMMLSLSMRGMVTTSKLSPMGSLVAARNGIVAMVMGLLFFGVIVGLVVMTIMFVIQRFWNGLLKEEGYLMFTLPVETWELITAKGLSATFVTCISGADAVFSCLVLALFSEEVILNTLADVWKLLTKELFEMGPVFMFSLVLILFLFILSVAQSIYHVYAAMALGQLFEGHRVLGSCVSYVGISIALSVATSIVASVTSWILPNSWSYNWWYYMNHSSEIMGLVYLLVMILFAAVEIIVYHVITERILSTRLNLE